MLMEPSVDAPDGPETTKPKPEDPASGPKVPPASETWVEGQPTSDADYQEPGREG